MKLTVKNARTNAGFTQEQAAEMIHCKKRWYISKESGEAFFTKQELETLCKEFGVEIEHLDFADAKYRARNKKEASKCSQS